MMYISLLSQFVVLFCLCNFYAIFTSINSAEIASKGERCQCGKHLRNRNATTIIAGQLYDTVVTLDDGFDANVQHAYSPMLQRCVAIKHCSEQQTRLNKCTRELEVLKALNASKNPHLIKFFDYEIQDGQTCNESGLWSDYLRMVVMGGDRKRRRRRSETEINNCTLVNTVMELGLEDIGHYWKRLKSGNKEKALQTVQKQISQALEELHNRGIAHRDVHPENVLIFTEQVNQAVDDPLLFKLIDFGWSCCFDQAKCGLKLAQILPNCVKNEALADDRFGLNDLIGELHKNVTENLD